jgi:hypothetical protein
MNWEQRLEQQNVTAAVIRTAHCRRITGARRSQTERTVSLKRTRRRTAPKRRETNAENKTAGARPASEANEKPSAGPAGFTDGEDSREDKQWHKETESVASDSTQPELKRGEQRTQHKIGQGSRGLVSTEENREDAEPN